MQSACEARILGFADEWARLRRPCGARRETYDLHGGVICRASKAIRAHTVVVVVVTFLAVSLLWSGVDVGNVEIPVVIEIFF